MKKRINILIYSLLTLLLSIGCLFGVSSFAGNKALALTRGGEEIYVGESSTFNLSSGEIGTSGTDAIYNDGTLNISGGTINGNIKNNGTINYTAGTINGVVTLAKGKYITLKAQPTKLTITLETLSDNLKILEYSGFTLDLSKVTVTNLGSNHTLYTQNGSVYVMQKRTITFSIKESGYGTVKNSAGTAVTSVVVPHGSSVTISGNKLTVGGNTYTATPSATTAQYTYAFSSWSISNNAAITANTTITATFTRTLRKYQVNFAVNDSSYGSVSSKYMANVEYGSTITVSNNTVRISGMTVSATATSQTPQYSYAFSSWSGVPSTNTVTGEITITANFTRATRKYTVTLIVNSSVFGSLTRENSLWNPDDTLVSQDSITVDYGKTLTVSGSDISDGTTVITAKPKTATGYTTTFNGWYLGTTKITSSTTITDATTITANFSRTANKYTVSFQPHGSPDYCAPITVTYNSTYGTLPSPTKSGYVFRGWWTGENGTGSNVTSSTRVTRTENHTLYAKWIVATYSITINNTGSSTTWKLSTESSYGTTSSYSGLIGDTVLNLSYVVPKKVELIRFMIR